MNKNTPQQTSGEFQRGLAIFDRQWITLENTRRPRSLDLSIYMFLSNASRHPENLPDASSSNPSSALSRPAVLHFFGLNEYGLNEYAASLCFMSLRHIGKGASQNPPCLAPEMYKIEALQFMLSFLHKSLANAFLDPGGSCNCRLHSMKFSTSRNKSLGLSSPSSNNLN